MRKWILGACAAVLGLAMLAPIAGFVVLHTDWGRDFVRGQIESRLNATFVGGARVGAVEGNPLAELVLRDVVINGPDRRPAISAKRVVVRFPLLPLLSHRLRAERVIVDDLDIRLSRELGHLLKPGDGAAWHVALPRVEVHRAHVALDHGIDLDQLELYASVVLPAVGPLDAAVSLQGRWRQRGAPIALAAVVRADRQIVVVPVAAGAVGDVKLALAGVHLPTDLATPPAGTVVIDAPATAVQHLIPEVRLPDDIALVIDSRPNGRATQVAIAGRLGRGTVGGLASVDLRAKRVTGVIAAAEIELASVTRGALDGRGGTLATFELDAAEQGALPSARGVITAWASTQYDKRTVAAIAFASAGDRARAAIGIASAGGVRAGIAASIRRRGDVVVLERGNVIASTPELARAAAPMHGRLRANLKASGELTPRLDLALAGTVAGRHVRFADLAVAALDARIDARHVPAHPSGSGRVQLSGFARGDLDGDLDARVTFGRKTIIDLLRHSVRVGGVVWRGDTGRLAIGPRAIELRDLRSTSEVGGVELSFAVERPRDFMDIHGWRRLRRAAIRDVLVALHDIDLARLDTSLHGRVDGRLELTASDATGLVTLHGVRWRGSGALDAELRVTQANHRALRANATARAGDARFVADATLVAPEHVFDPAEWRRLGANAFRGATLRADGLAFEPGTLQRLGIASPLRGELAVGAELDEGLRALRFSIDLRQLRGGLLAKPITANVEGVIDDRSTRATAQVCSRGITLVQLAAELPVTLAELRRDPRALVAAPLSATATIEQVPATAFTSVTGTSQITGGTLDGTIEIAGTVARPTVDAKLVARDVSVPGSGTDVQALEQLSLSGTWDGGRATIEVDAREAGGGTLQIRAEGAPDRLAAVTASVTASRIELAPLVAFLPGPASGLGGVMEANLSVRGADLRTGEVAGTLHITNGRIPIAAEVGTLFHTDLRIDIANRVLGLALAGKLGRGDVNAVASAPLDGVTPRSGKARVTIHDVQLIGTTEPILTGVVEADIARVDNVWRSNVAIHQLKIKVPSHTGNKLAPVGPPTDLVFSDEKLHHGKLSGKEVRHGPSKPLLVANADIRNVFVESDVARGLVGGKLTVSLAPDDIGIVGNLAFTRAVLDLFGRRYEVERASVQFDGSPDDPVLDVRITHDFPEATTITDVRGRVSDPELVLSSQPARYSQAELLGFLLGGAPGGDPVTEPSASARVAGAGASLVGNKIGGYIRRALPVDIDVLRYEAASATSSAAITVGTWLTDTLFLAYRRHLEPRPDQNASEGEFEYWIRRRLVLEGVVGDSGVYGADLLWRKRW